MQTDRGATIRTCVAMWLCVLLTTFAAERLDAFEYGGAVDEKAGGLFEFANYRPGGRQTVAGVDDAAVYGGTVWAKWIDIEMEEPLKREILHFHAGITTEKRDYTMAKNAAMALDLALKIDEDLTNRQNQLLSQAR